jgi:hypothetical protein
MSEAEIEAERAWDRICGDLDEEKKSRAIRHDRDQDSAYLKHWSLVGERRGISRLADEGFTS